MASALPAAPFTMLMQHSLPLHDCVIRCLTTWGTCSHAELSRRFGFVGTEHPSRRLLHSDLTKRLYKKDAI